MSALQGQANVHLSIRYHHESLHCQVERLPKQAGWKVSFIIHIYMEESNLTSCLIGPNPNPSSQRPRPRISAPGPSSVDRFPNLKVKTRRWRVKSLLSTNLSQLSSILRRCTICSINQRDGKPYPFSRFFSTQNLSPYEKHASTAAMHFYTTQHAFPSTYSQGWLDRCGEYGCSCCYAMTTGLGE